MNSGFFQSVILIASATFLAGCATAPKTMNEQDTLSLHGTRLTVIHYEPDPFLPMTNTKGAFAVLGVAAAVTEGKELVKEHGLEDPAIDIKTTLAGKLSDTYQISDITIVQEAKPYESNPEEVAALASHDGVILDVRTFGWGTTYYPFKTKYKVNYMAQARLINARDKRLISAERCMITEKYSDDSPSYDELMENGAVLLKKKLADASTECVAQFAEKMGAKQSVALKP